MCDQATTVRIGVLGAADIATKNVRGILKASSPIEVVAVGSRSLEKAERFIAEAGLKGKAQACGSYQAVLDRDDVDAVYIPLPSALHAEWVKKAAAAAKSVLCDKPLALNWEDAEAMIRACEEAGVQFMDGTMWLHNPRTPRVKQAMREVLGTPRTVESSFSFLGSQEFFKSDVRCQPGLDGMGSLGDLGWYCIGFALWAFDYDLPATATALPGTRLNSQGVPMSAGATLVWADGRVAVFHSSFERLFVQRVQVSGTDGEVRLDDFVLPRQEGESRFVSSSKHLLQSGRRRAGDGGDQETSVSEDRRETAVRLDRPQETCMWEEFAACVRAIKGGGKPDPRWPDASAATQKVLIAAYKSVVEGGKTVAIE